MMNAVMDPRRGCLMNAVMDPRRGYPVQVGKIPAITDGFVWWEGELREVLDVHQTRSGTQIELVAQTALCIPKRAPKVGKE